MNNSRKYTRNYYNLFYYLAVILLVIKTCSDSSEILNFGETIDTLIFAFAIAGVVIKIIATPMPISLLLTITITGLLSLYSGLKSGNYHIFTTWLILSGSYKTNYNNLIKSIIYTLLVIIVLHTAVYFVFYIFGDVNKILYIKSFKEVYGNTLFFGNPNAASTYILWGTLGLLYLRKSRINYLSLLLCLVIFLISYFLTTSRTGLYLGIFSVIFLTLNFVNKDTSKFFSFLVKYEFLILTIAIITSCLLFQRNNNLAIKINSILSGRILLSNFALQYFGPTLFGRRIDLTLNYGSYSNWTVTRLAIDVMPMRFIVQYGIIFIALYELILFKSDKYLSEFERILIIIMITESLFEIYPMNASICFPLAICGWHLTNEGEKNEKI